MRVIGVIPARLASSRLPEKLLLQETGKPLLQYTWEAACQATSLAEVIVATDSEQIAQTVRDFGGTCQMTRDDHPSGTDRIAEVIRRDRPNVDIVVNIQGDEPDVDPAHLDRLARLLAENPTAEMATLSTPIRTREQWSDPSCTKVVCAASGAALYFSRCPIPYYRDGDVNELLAGDSPWQLHLGLYAYRREFLLRLTELPQSPLEKLERLEQLRALEAGATIQVGSVAHPAAGIDTPEDYARFVRRRGHAA